MKTMIKQLLLPLALMAICTHAGAQGNPIQQAFTKSYTYENVKDYNNAIAAMRTAYDSTSYEMNLRLGWLNYKAGFFPASMTFYQRAVRIKPTSVEAKIGYNYPAYSVYNTDNIIEMSKKILELDPKNTGVCYNLGYLYFHKGDYKTAESYMKQVLELYPFNYDALSLSAQANTNLGNKQEAMERLQHLLLFSPNDQNARDEVASLGLDLKWHEAQEKAFTDSYLAFSNGDYPGALKPLLDIYDAKSYEMNLRLGYLFYMSGMHKESMDYYKVAIELRPNALEPRFGYVYPLSALNLTEELVAQYEAILKIDPKNSDVNYQLGYINFNKKDFPAAYNNFKTVVTAYPFSYEGLAMFAKTSYQMGKKDEAKDLYARVLLLAPTNREALDAYNKLK